MLEGRECPRCGSLLPPEDAPKRGRRRIWCSQDCRRAAHAQRTAAELGTQPVRVVEVPRIAPVPMRPVIVPRPVTSAEAADHVLGHNEALRYVLRSLTARAIAEGFGSELYGDALDFADAVQAQATAFGADEFDAERICRELGLD